ncbi:hypothetical protein ABLE68_08620 [Nocardioides sp. CN2-186]|uniref:hypothetical protein n=1 Tax=Nocardioides tweenelious TaxID=3156607 RepID=UPI0032B4ED15
MEPITGTPTQTIRTEMDAVLNEGVRVAADYLARFDTFIPFAIRYRDGQLEQLEVSTTDASAEVRSQDAYDALVAGLADQDDDVHALAIVTDVLVSKGDEAQGDAIRIELEHRDSAAWVVEAFAAYERDESGRPTLADELVTSDGTRRIWV